MEKQLHRYRGFYKPPYFSRWLLHHQPVLDPTRILLAWKVFISGKTRTFSFHYSSVHIHGDSTVKPKGEPPKILVDKPSINGCWWFFDLTSHSQRIQVCVPLLNPYNKKNLLNPKKPPWETLQDIPKRSPSSQNSSGGFLRESAHVCSIGERLNLGKPW